MPSVRQATLRGGGAIRLKRRDGRGNYSEIIRVVGVHQSQSRFSDPQEMVTSWLGRHGGDRVVRLGLEASANLAETVAYPLYKVA